MRSTARSAFGIRGVRAFNSSFSFKFRDATKSHSYRAQAASRTHIADAAFRVVDRLVAGGTRQPAAGGGRPEEGALAWRPFLWGDVVVWPARGAAVREAVAAHALH